MDEQRLIDANALLGKRRRFFEPKELESVDPIASTCVTTDDIYCAPTIDAVPVVRCRECMHRGNPDVCPWSHKELRQVAEGTRWVITDGTVFDGFCHLGAKMDGGSGDELHAT